MRLICLAGCLWALAACGKQATPAHGLAHGIAVINSDYQTTALTLLDPDANTVVDPCLSSGSATPRLSLALSGDVVLASGPDVGGALILVDRSNGAIAWVDPNTCGVQQQIAVSPGFKGNPHDVVSIRSDKAYVTLFDPSTDGSAGNNVVIVNPQTSALSGNIIVSTLATQDGNGINTLARPDRALLTGGVVFVSLGNINADYDSWGPGRILLIDPNSDAILQHIDIPEGRGCSGMAAAGNVLVVGCDGDLSNPASPAYSGYWIYDISDVRAPLLTRSVAAAQLKRQAVVSAGLAVNTNHIYVIGTANGVTDGVYQDASLLFSASGSYELTGLVFNDADLYVGDAETANPAIVRAQGADILGRINSAPHSLLPPRALSLY